MVSLPVRLRLGGGQSGGPLVEAMLQGRTAGGTAALVEAGEKKNAVKAAALRLKKLLQGEERP